MLTVSFDWGFEERVKKREWEGGMEKHRWVLFRINRGSPVQQRRCTSRISERPDSSWDIQRTEYPARLYDFPFLPRFTPSSSVSPFSLLSSVFHVSSRFIFRRRAGTLGCAREVLRDNRYVSDRVDTCVATPRGSRAWIIYFEKEKWSASAPTSASTTIYVLYHRIHVFSFNKSSWSSVQIADL